MKIAIDTSSLVYATGVSVYTRNLIENLLKIDKDNEYILFGGSLRRFQELRDILYRIGGESPGNKKVRLFPLPPTLADIIWNKFHILRIEKLVGNIDVFHSSDWTQPPTNAFKVTTIHDIVPLKFPEVSHPKIVSAHKTRLRWVIREVDRVVVPSQTTAQDVERLGINREKIRIIPEACDPFFKSVAKSQIERIKRRYRIPGKYLLAVGVSHRKNTQRIIEAFQKVKVEANLRLVIVGQPFMKIKGERGVIFVGHIPEVELPAIYSGADVLVYPSLYEGFGLPILEAFESKLPVVTSNFGSMAEVAADAAVLVDPYDVNSISDGIFKAIKNKDKLVEKGLRRLKNFSWEKTAKKTLEVYKESFL